MSAIEKIQIKGFKAFPNEFTLKLDGNHLLMYGENGSGKSSIYFALHCLYQSSLKSDAGKKYFNVLNEDGSENYQHLLNRNTIDEDAYIKVSFMGGPWNYTINRAGCTPTLLGGHRVHFPIECCFINHNFIFRFFNFRNSENINLFPVFLKDILSFYVVPEHGIHISEMYDYLTTNKVPKNGRAKTLFLLQLESFNQETKRVVENINLTASDRYNHYFKDENDRDLQIRLRYDSNTEKRQDKAQEYWLKYDNIFEEQIIQGVRRVRRSPYKKWNRPFIGLEISEKIADGKYRPIPKPQSYFNEAKLTAIALSIRFSLLNLDKPADGRFLALDDMLISLDMSNRTKVISFLLDISNKYKIYLFTHDKAFYDYVCRAIKQSGTQSEWIYKTISYCPSKNAPILLDNYGNYISKAIHFYNIGDYETSAIYARKEFEQCIGELLPYELKVRADGGFVNLETLWAKLIKFYSDNGKVLDKSMQKLFNNSKLLILNVAAHYQRLSFPIYKIELEQVFTLIKYIHSLNKIEKKLLIPAKTPFEFQHPTKPYYCRFELESDLVVEIGDHIVSILPKCQNIFWKYSDIEYYNFETGKEDRGNRLITANPKLVNFIQNMPKEIKVTEDEFISNCWIEGNRLDVYLCGVKFSQMVKA